MVLANMLFCFAAVYFIAQFTPEDEPWLFWLNVLSFFVNLTAVILALP